MLPPACCLCAMYPAPWERLFPQVRSSPGRAGQGRAAGAPVRAMAGSRARGPAFPWPVMEHKDGSRADRLFIHFPACPGMAGPRLVHAGAFVFVDEELGIPVFPAPFQAMKFVLPPPSHPVPAPPAPVCGCGLVFAPSTSCRG